jgi:ketosteroid isomerase-like protein
LENTVGDCNASADLQTLRQLMTDDIVVVHGNGRTVRGREAVAAVQVAACSTTARRGDGPARRG